MASALKTRLLQVCGCYCLHPEDEASQENHIEACQLRYRRELGRSVSAQMECCICLEVSLASTTQVVCAEWACPNR